MNQRTVLCLVSVVLTLGLASPSLAQQTGTVSGVVEIPKGPFFRASPLLLRARP